MSTFAPPTCDDTSAFKSQADLIALSHLKDFYICHATKEVPGLGSIPWAANARVGIQNGKLTFQFHTGLQYLQSLLLRENLVFHNVLPEEGIYYGYGGYGRTGSDGDVFDGAWGADTLCTNYIEITHLDLECMEVSGNFEVHLKMVEQGTFGVLYSERINFLNGKFKSRIYNF